MPLTFIGSATDSIKLVIIFSIHLQLRYPTQSWPLLPPTWEKLPKGDAQIPLFLKIVIFVTVWPSHLGACRRTMRALAVWRGVQYVTLDLKIAALVQGQGD